MIWVKSQGGAVEPGVTPKIPLQAYELRVMHVMYVQRYGTCSQLPRGRPEDRPYGRRCVHCRRCTFVAIIRPRAIGAGSGPKGL